MAQQLSFDLPVRPALGREDFLVAPSNAMAVVLLESWRDWPGGKLVISGPKGAGKTHLAHVWATAADARIIAATDLTEDSVPQLAEGNVAIEDVPQIAKDTAAQTALFHLHNLTLANGHRLLLTGTGTPAHWALSLPDLQSRIQGTQHATLDLPDDDLLAALLAKLFSDRQIVPKPDVIPFLVPRIDRSYEAAAQTVAGLDRAALDQKSNLSRVFVQRWLTGQESIEFGD